LISIDKGVQKASSAQDKRGTDPYPENRSSIAKAKTNSKTYNSGYSLVVTHLTTNPPVRCLNRAERTGSLVFNVLWSYVTGCQRVIKYILSAEVGGNLCPIAFCLPFLFNIIPHVDSPINCKNTA
jgi:hypothetical protein